MSTLTHDLDLRITAPFALGDVTALIHRDGDAPIAIVLRDGRFSGPIPGRALRLQLTTDPAPAGEPPLRLAGPEAAGAPEGPAIDVDDLFEPGAPIPDYGRLIRQIVWAAHCHHEPVGDVPGERRFGSYEHMLCTAYVGRAAVAETKVPLTVHGITMDVFDDTPMDVADKRLRFSDLVALGGDFYAHLDRDAVRDCAKAWPPLAGLAGWFLEVDGDYRLPPLAEDSSTAIWTLLERIKTDKDSGRGSAGEFANLALDTMSTSYSARRYLALASQNFCHFAATGKPGDEGPDAGTLYVAYHARAMREAATRTMGALQRALVIDAFGCHFLTDLFASGHMRVPRRLLAARYGILRGSLRMSMAMHEEDNELGLWCTTKASVEGRAPRVVWRAYGDGHLRKDVAHDHLRQVQEAVRRSAAEVFTAHVTGDVNPVLPVPVVDVLPVPLGPGEAPGFATLPDGRPIGDARPNHWPLYLVTADGTVASRKGTPEDPRYP